MSTPKRGEFVRYYRWNGTDWDRYKGRVSVAPDGPHAVLSLQMRNPNTGDIVDVADVANVENWPLRADMEGSDCWVGPANSEREDTL